MWEPCLSFPVANRPLSLATRHRLGRRLPYQQADRTWASLPAASYDLYPPNRRDYGVLSFLSKSYPPLRGKFPCVTHPFAALRLAAERSTCMPKAHRQRSSWTRIKFSKKIDFTQFKIPTTFWLSKCCSTLIRQQTLFEPHPDLIGIRREVSCGGSRRTILLCIKIKVNYQRYHPPYLSTRLTYYFRQRRINSARLALRLSEGRLLLEFT